MPRAPIATALGAMLGMLAACGTYPGTTSASEPGPDRLQVVIATQTVADDRRPDPLPLRVPIRGVMAGIIDFSAHGVFETSTSEMPLTESDWRAAGLASINLIGSATLITTTGTGPEDAKWVSDSEWHRWAQAMQSASISAGVAITRKDQAAYLAAANRLADACQSCHTRFRPDAPLSNSQFAENVRRGLNLNN